jgi:hypothetical protein
MSQEQIKEKLLPVWGKIFEVINSASGATIGTGLEQYLEESITPILPEGIDYDFMFNMSGQIQHIFFEKRNPSNAIIL